MVGKLGTRGWCLRVVMDNNGWGCGSLLEMDGRPLKVYLTSSWATEGR